MTFKDLFKQMHQISQIQVMNPQQAARIYKDNYDEVAYSNLLINVSGVLQSVGLSFSRKIDEDTIISIALATIHESALAWNSAICRFVTAVYKRYKHALLRCLRDMCRDKRDYTKLTTIENYNEADLTNLLDAVIIKELFKDLSQEEQNLISYILQHKSSDGDGHAGIYRQIVPDYYINVLGYSSGTGRKKLAKLRDKINKLAVFK